MKRTVHFVLALILLLLTVLSSCSGPSLSLAETKSAETAAAEAETKAAQTLAEEVKTVAEKKSQFAQRDPASDGVLTVLVIGNSFSTGWPDELNGLLKAAGVKARVYTVYYSGCPLSSHWEWLRTGQAYYRLRHHKQGGGVEDESPVNLKHCLKAENWDVISLQQHFGPAIAVDYDAALKSCTPYAENLFNYLKENFPKSKLVWHQTWAYEVGWKSDGQSIPDVQTQLLCHQNIRAVSQKIATDNGVALIPCGDSFQIARENGSGDLSRDGYHDGPENGGQYLNACTWFECLTGESCVGNTWRPSSYTLTEERVANLQSWAHRAVEENTIR